MEFKRLWSIASDIDYDPAKTVELLENFNNAINGLYSLSGETRFIADTLNSATYEIAEYDRLIATIGNLAEVADTLEMARNLLFGGCVDWGYILSGFRKMVEEKRADKAITEDEE